MLEEPIVERRRAFENDPLMVERRAHAETSQELAEAKEQVAHFSRRCVTLYEETKRKPLDSSAVDALLMVGVERGRVDPSDLDEWRRKLEASPSETIVELAGTPAAAVQPRVFLSEDDDEAYRDEASARLGLEVL
jgi:hypothetical protein